MPPRIITAGILLFWLAMTGLLVEREVVPMMMAQASPTYQIDLTDEIGSSLVSWKVLHDGEEIGTAISRLNALDSRNFEFRSTHQFTRLTIPVPAIPVKLRGLESTFRVNDEGKLQGLSAKVSINVLMKDHHMEIKGEVENQVLKLRGFASGAEKTPIDLGTIDLERQGNAVNMLHLLNRMRGLYEGRTWTVPNLDLAGGSQSQYLSAFTKNSGSAPTLIATVHADTLKWDRKNVRCYMVEYREPDKDEVLARTWVRRIDGLVLQQEARILGKTIVSQRTPD